VDRPAVARNSTVVIWWPTPRGLRHTPRSTTCLSLQERHIARRTWTLPPRTLSVCLAHGLARYRALRFKGSPIGDLKLPLPVAIVTVIRWTDSPHCRSLSACRQTTPGISSEHSETLFALTAKSADCRRRHLLTKSPYTGATSQTLSEALEARAPWSVAGDVVEVLS
jgi:hypothetical protein